jgi:hypothetical protein
MKKSARDKKITAVILLYQHEQCWCRVASRRCSTFTAFIPGPRTLAGSVKNICNVKNMRTSNVTLQLRTLRSFGPAVCTSFPFHVEVCCPYLFVHFRGAFMSPTRTVPVKRYLTASISADCHWLFPVSFCLVHSSSTPSLCLHGVRMSGNSSTKEKKYLKK